MNSSISKYFNQTLSAFFVLGESPRLHGCDNTYQDANLYRMPSGDSVLLHSDCHVICANARSVTARNGAEYLKITQRTGLSVCRVEIITVYLFSCASGCISCGTTAFAESDLKFHNYRIPKTRYLCCAVPNLHGMLAAEGFEMVGKDSPTCRGTALLGCLLWSQAGTFHSVGAAS
jgi:hypothetical protein